MNFQLNIAMGDRDTSPMWVIGGRIKCKGQQLVNASAGGEILTNQGVNTSVKTRCEEVRSKLKFREPLIISCAKFVKLTLWRTVDIWDSIMWRRRNSDVVANRSYTVDICIKEKNNMKLLYKYKKCIYRL